MPKASEWKQRAQEDARAEAAELLLPSGMKILARRPDAAQMAVWGRLPLQLAAAAGKGQSEVASSSDEAIELMAFMRDLLVYVCVEPRISLAPTSDEEIHPRDIPQEDWQFLFRWAMRFEEGRNLEGFRGQRAGDRPGNDGQDVGSAAIADAGDSGPGFSTEF